jgi:M6 family metalloprotease-like protein
MIDVKTLKNKTISLILALIVTVIVVISVIVLFPRKVETPSVGVPKLSIAELKANYKQYEGTLVTTSGVLSTYYGAATIHYLFDQTDLIKLTFPITDQSQYETQNVEVTGYVRVEDESAWIEVASIEAQAGGMGNYGASLMQLPNFNTIAFNQAADPVEHWIVVVLIEFQDVRHDPTHTRDFFRRLFFDNSPNANSMYNYYKEASYGRISLRGEVFGWYRSTENSSFYGKDSVPNDVAGGHIDDANGPIFELAREAVQLANNGVDFSRYDNNGDGKVDHIAIVFAGNPQAWSTVADDIWSHRWIIQPAERVDGVRVENYTMQSENNRIATYAHEFGHDLGLPDLYDINNRQEFAGHWDLMASGTRLNDGLTPPHFSSWTKLKLGWIPQASVQTVPRNQTERITMYALNQSPSDFTPSTVKVQVTNNTYYLIEARRPVGYDSGLPDNGVLIYWCDDRIGSGRGPVRVVDAFPNSVAGGWDTDDAPFGSQFVAGENFLFDDTANQVRVTVLARIDGGFIIDVSSGAPVPNYSAIISYVSPSEFDGGVRTKVTLTVWNIGDATTLRVSPANVPVGWQVDDDEADAGNDRTIQLNPLGHGTLDFYVTPPIIGGTANLTWELYSPGHQARLLDTYLQSMTATATALGQQLGTIASAMENLLENFIGGLDTTVTVSVQNLGDLGTLIAAPENIPFGWRVDDTVMDLDLDDNEMVHMASGMTENIRFHVIPPDDGGTATLTWSLYYDNGFGRRILLDTYKRVVSAAPARQKVYMGDIVSATLENFAESIQGGKTTSIFVSFKNTGDSGFFVLAPENAPSGWKITASRLWDDERYQTIYLKSGATENIDFYVTSPENGGAETFTWKLYYGKDWLENLVYLDTLERTIVAFGKYSGETSSVSPSNFIGGESTSVTVTIRNTGEAGTLIVSPEQVSSGWTVDDDEIDNDNLRSVYLESGDSATLTFIVMAPETSSSGLITWKLYFENMETLLDTYIQYLTATERYSGEILSVGPSNLNYYENTPITVTIKNTGVAGTFIVKPENFSWYLTVDDNEPDADIYKTAYLTYGQTASLTFKAYVWSYLYDENTINWKLYFSDWSLLDNYRQQLYVTD